LLTLFSMTKIWAEAFWKPSPAAVSPLVPAGLLLPLLPITLLALFTITMGLLAEPLLILATRAAEQLLNPADYIQTVLGG
jgi:multicomponent Na+:H+ antiporter subunit D